jgi:hypothetical protein
LTSSQSKISELTKSEALEFSWGEVVKFLKLLKMSKLSRLTRITPMEL